MENRFPSWLIVLYASSVLIAFLVSSIEVEGAIAIGNAQITLSPSQWAWLLPVSVMLPLIVRIFLSKGGTFKWFGIEAQVNIAREAKEAAQYADAKAQNVFNDFERAVSDINAQLREIQQNVELNANDAPPGEISSSMSESVQAMVHTLAEEYRQASGPEASVLRKATNQKIRDLPSVDPESIYTLTGMSWEYQAIGAILLRRLATAPDQSGKAFDELLRLLAQGPNSLVRFRAANSLRQADWHSISPDMLKDRLDVLKQRSHIEPNEPTAKEIHQAIDKFAKRLSS